MKAKAKLHRFLKESEAIVFLGGAGVSTESGIPDFRSAQGIYQKAHAYPPEQILSREFFESQPQVFYDFFRRNLIHLQARPNAAHLRLAELEQEGKLTHVITQNIDGLHQKAGSRRVIELHGSVMQALCVGCGLRVSVDVILKSQGVPRCQDCDGLIKPDVVLFGEPLDPDRIKAAVRAIQAADLLIVGGTSLSVYPAAGLVDFFAGRRLVLINQSQTAWDDKADLTVRQPIGEALAQG